MFLTRLKAIEHIRAPHNMDIAFVLFVSFVIPLSVILIF